jgi:hypothetical protein
MTRFDEVSHRRVHNAYNRVRLGQSNVVPLAVIEAILLRSCSTDLLPAKEAVIVAMIEEDQVNDGDRNRIYGATQH